MYRSILTFVAIILLLCLIYMFYCYTPEYVQVKTSETVCQKNEKNEGKCGGSGDLKIAFLANRGSNYLEARIVNVIIAKSQYYVYSDKKAYHVEQLQNDNRVSLLIYTKQGETMKQVLLYGELESVNDTPNLILYKLKIDHRKVGITVETSLNRSTSYTYDGGNQKDLVTDFSELNALVSSLSI